jgi:predicted alpha/beta hydrolase family esterase
VRNQAKFIRETRLSEIEDGALADAADKIYYISSAHDHVVNTDAAYEKINRIFGGKVVRIVDLLRDETGHADGPEQPDLIVQLMEGYPPQSDEPNVMPLPLPEPEQLPIRIPMFNYADAA